MIVRRLYTMDEKTEQEAKKPETQEPTPDTSTGVQSETENQFDKASKITKDLHTALDRNEKLIERQEKLEVQRQLAGKGVAGIPQPKPIDKAQEAADARIKAIGDATGARWAKNMEKNLQGDVTK